MHRPPDSRASRVPPSHLEPEHHHTAVRRIDAIQLFQLYGRVRCKPHWTAVLCSTIPERAVGPPLVSGRRLCSVKHLRSRCWKYYFLARLLCRPSNSGGTLYVQRAGIVPGQFVAALRPRTRCHSLPRDRPVPAQRMDSLFIRSQNSQISWLHVCPLHINGHCRSDRPDDSDNVGHGRKYRIYGVGSVVELHPLQGCLVRSCRQH